MPPSPSMSHTTIAPLILLLVAILALGGCVGLASEPTATPNLYPTPLPLPIRSPVPTALPGEELTFESVMQTGDANYNGKDLTAYLVSKTSGFETVDSLLFKGNGHVDFNDIVDSLEPSEFLIAVFRHTTPSTGYEIHVTQVTKEGNNLTVYVELCDPKDRQGYSESAVTTYHDIVRFKLSDVSLDDLNVRVVGYEANCWKVGG